jgi:hypothetical protein
MKLKSNLLNVFKKATISYKMGTPFMIKYTLCDFQL